MTELALMDVQCPCEDCGFEGVDVLATVHEHGFVWTCPDCDADVFEPFDRDNIPMDDPYEPWMDPDSIDDSDEEVSS